MNWKNEIWFNHTKVEAFRNMLQGGVYEIRGDKLRLAHEQALMYDTPWIFVGYTPLLCEFQLNVLWMKFKFRTAYCRTRCFKVVARPRNVAELFKLHLLMGQIYTMHGFGGKCGVDIRWYGPGFYSAYWYNDGLEAGQACYEAVHEAISAEISPEFADDEDCLFLKHACTEMECPTHGGTPSDTWGEPTEADMRQEATYDEMLGTTTNPGAQPPWLHNKIQYYWLQAANMIGDRSYLEFTSDIAPTVTIKYHKRLGGDVGSKPELVELKDEREIHKGGK